jgi:hypothetical protein
LRHIQYKPIAKRRAIATLAIFRPRRIIKRTAIYTVLQTVEVRTTAALLLN